MELHSVANLKNGVTNLQSFGTAVNGVRQSANPERVRSGENEAKGSDFVPRVPKENLKAILFIPEAPEELQPKSGKEFESLEAAENFYKEYARWCGFSIRKGHVRRFARSGELRERTFTCSKEGKRHKKYIEATERKRRPKAMTRCECPAMMKVGKKKGSGAWFVKEFLEKHSHELVNPNKAYFQPLHRHVLESHTDVMANMQEVGICPTKALNFSTNETRVHENVGFLDREIKNALKRRRLDRYGGGGQALLNYFRNKRAEDDGFNFAIEVDEELRLTSCFWVDDKSKEDYEAFGDVICFDAMYKTNEFDILFGLFVGINNHRQSILFGAGLLFEEAIENFEWLFQTWLQAMGGKPPNLIITDHDPTITAAIALVFPKTEHHFCMWHILQKFPKKMAYAIDAHPSFNSEWKNCIYNAKQSEDFESLWSKMLFKYRLEESEWIQDLYKIRKKWIPIYLKNISFAGMLTTKRSEGIDAFLNYFMGHNSTLLEFAEGYEKFLEEQRRTELAADASTTYATPVALTPIPLEDEMAKIYTVNVFSEFQKEVKESMVLVAQLVEKIGPVSKYNIFYCRNDDVTHCIEWHGEDQVGFCSCRNFEFCGIICSHLLAVFRDECVLKMPKHYILKRWTCHAKAKDMIDVQCQTQSARDSIMVRRNNITHIMSFLIDEGSKTAETYAACKPHLEEAITAVCEVSKMTETSRH